MKINKEEVKEVWFYQRRVTILFFIIITAFLGSCDSNDDLPSLPNDPQDTTLVVVIDTTVVMDTTIINAPIILTPAPLIHLADNLDEQDQLGWCIDTRGNGFNENIHLHSCKASGGDVQFIYNEETLQICSAEFVGFCIEMSGGSFEGSSLILVESNSDTPDQRFVYNEDNGEFNAEEDTNLCLAAGETSTAAGIYMSRSLTLELSSEIEESLKKWVIVAE